MSIWSSEPQKSSFLPITWSKSEFFGSKMPKIAVFGYDWLFFGIVFGRKMLIQSTWIFYLENMPDFTRKSRFFNIFGPKNLRVEWMKIEGSINRRQYRKFGPKKCFLVGISASQRFSGTPDFQNIFLHTGYYLVVFHVFVDFEPKFQNVHGAYS